MGMQCIKDFITEYYNELSINDVYKLMGTSWEMYHHLDKINYNIHIPCILGSCDAIDGNILPAIGYEETKYMRPNIRFYSIWSIILAKSDVCNIHDILMLTATCRGLYSTDVNNALNLLSIANDWPERFILLFHESFIDTSCLTGILGRAILKDMDGLPLTTYVDNNYTPFNTVLLDLIINNGIMPIFTDDNIDADVFEDTYIWFLCLCSCVDTDGMYIQLTLHPNYNRELFCRYIDIFHNNNAKNMRIIHETTRLFVNTMYNQYGSMPDIAIEYYVYYEQLVRNQINDKLSQ